MTNISDYKGWIFTNTDEILIDDDFTGNFVQHHECGALHIVGTFADRGIPSGQFCCYDKHGFLSQLIVFRSNGSLMARYSFDQNWYIGSISSVEYGDNSSDFAYSKSFYNGKLGMLKMEIASDLQLNNALVQGLPKTKIAIDAAKRSFNYARDIPTQGIISNEPNVLADLPGEDARPVYANQYFPVEFGGLGPAIQSAPIPCDYEGIAVGEGEDSGIECRGRWLPGREPIAQHLMFWPNGCVKEFSYWCFKRLIGIRANFYPSGNLHKEEHYGPNGSIDGTGIIVEYTQNSKLLSIRKLVAQRPVADIIDPQTNYPFHVVNG